MSNEDSQDGICDRCHGKVVQEERWVWYLKMRDYAEKLLENVDNIEMKDSLKESQRNWIGKTKGFEIKFPIVDNEGNIISEEKIFTKDIENLIGVSFLSLAPENKLLEKVKMNIKNYDEVLEYQKQTSYRSNFDRISKQKDKTACVLEGVYGINPYTNEKIPLYITDMVLPTEGMAIELANPNVDNRYMDLALKYDINILSNISKEFEGLTKKEIAAYLEKKLRQKGIIDDKINYKMQDWSFNRQRYWGEPFPVVFCDDCGVVPMEEKDLPLTIPYTTDFLPQEDGSSPLSKISDWVNCKCPKCGKDAKRETDTMPNWAGSSWYWLRYCDPHNDKALADFEKLKYWGSVDCYTGGTEHITRHVLYAFFWQNFLYEIGAVPTRDPFVRKMGSGLILDDTGKKMSKSSANGVSPMEVIDEYGTDVARLHVHFLGGYEDNTPWTYDGISGITSFINKVWDLQNIVKDGDISDKHAYEVNALIKKVGDDLENLKLNTAIASLMSFINLVRRDKYITKEELRIFLILLNPLAPHITSEMYEILFNGNIIDDKWPEYDEAKLEKNEINLPIQINGKMKKTILVDANIDDEMKIVDMIKEEYPGMISGDIKKVIYIKGKIINIIL